MKVYQVFFCFKKKPVYEYTIAVVYTIKYTCHYKARVEQQQSVLTDIEMAVQVHVLHSLCVLFVASLLQVHCIRLSPNAEQDNSVEVLVQYIRPDNGVNSSCPGLPCETLDYYASVSHCNNTQFILMPGLHTLSRNFTLSCLENVAFIGRNGTRDSNNTGVRIQCDAAVGFIFENVTFLTLKDLRISHCG